MRSAEEWIRLNLWLSITLVVFSPNVAIEPQTNQPVTSSDLRQDFCSAGLMLSLENGYYDPQGTIRGGKGDNTHPFLDMGRDLGIKQGTYGNRFSLSLALDRARIHSLTIAHFRLKAEGTQTLSQNISLDKVNLTAGTKVETTIAFKNTDYIYSYRIISSYPNRSRTDLDLLAGLSNIHFNVGLHSKNASALSDGEEYTADHTILVGLRSGFELSPSWSLESAFTGTLPLALGESVEDTRDNYEVAIKVRYKLSNSLQLSAGYRTIFSYLHFRGSESDKDVVNKTIDSNVSGFYFGANLGF